MIFKNCPLRPGGYHLFLRLCRVGFVQRIAYQVEDGCVDTEGTDSRGDEQNPYSFTSQRAEVKERRSIVHFVLIFDFALLILEMQNGAALRVIQRRGAVKRPKEKR